MLSSALRRGITLNRISRYVNDEMMILLLMHAKGNDMESNVCVPHSSMSRRCRWLSSAAREVMEYDVVTVGAGPAVGVCDGIDTYAYI